MGQPAQPRDNRLDAQLARIAARPFGLSITSGPDGLSATGLAFPLLPGAGPFDSLQTQIARGNLQRPSLDGQKFPALFWTP